MSDAVKCYHFVTGRLAEHAVRDTVEKVAEKVGFRYSIQVLPITVAALITSKWLLRHLELPPQCDCLFLPGYLEREYASLQESLPVEILIGPRDIRDLPMFFGQKANRDDYGEWDIEILAEINHANQLSLEELLREAQKMVRSGADIIDLGCTPNQPWSKVRDAVCMLRDEGLRVSIDSFDQHEVTQACSAGAELVLSVNSTNREASVDWGAEVVVIPDTPGDKKSFEKTIVFLAEQNIPMRLDPILEPIGCGFAESLRRYAECRELFPEATMMMGIGNLTELTDCDSAGVNVLLLGICQELGIRSVLTTQVINWARSSVEECDMGRRLVHYACKHGVPPKHLEPNLVSLRDIRVSDYPVESLEALAAQIRDKNIRIFCSNGLIHAVSAVTHVKDEDPFKVMDLLLNSEVGPSINASHAFYLGYEMAKAHTANTLRKQYTQDEALDWGYLTRQEQHHRLARTHRAKDE